LRPVGFVLQAVGRDAGVDACCRDCGRVGVRRGRVRGRTPGRLSGRASSSLRASHYQRGSRRRLPPPPPIPPPRPPPPPVHCGFGRASLTARVRPPSCVSFRSVTAFCASASVAISTNANPRARPVAVSRTTLTVSTAPDLLNRFRSSSSETEYGRLPT